MPTSKEVEDIVRGVAYRFKFRDPDVLVATVNQESGFNPYAVGDSGHSRGIFQENDRGRGAGLAPEQSFDPAAATERAIREFNATYRPEYSRGQWAAAAQRPYDRVGYAKRIDTWLAAGNARSTATPGAAPAVEAGDPDWFTDYLRQQRQPVPAPGRAAPLLDESDPAWYREAVAAGLVGAVSGRSDAAGADGALVWPLAGQDPARRGVNNPFGAPQVRSAGFTGSLPAVNYGVDLAARPGDPVVAPAAGIVSRVLTADGANYGYGNSVVVDIGGGREIQLSHFQDTPAVRVGQRVAPGTLLGHAGRSGNATGVHLDLAAREKGRPVDAMTWFGGAPATPASTSTPPPGRALTADANDPDWYREWVAGQRST